MNKSTRMNIAIVFLLALALVTACSAATEPGRQEAKNVKVELATDPLEVRAGQPTKLTALVEGMTDEKKATVQFEIRRADNKTLPDMTDEAAYEGKGRYSSEYAFKEHAEYDVYIHVYNGELHITKKRPVEVSE